MRKDGRNDHDGINSARNTGMLLNPTIEVAFDAVSLRTPLRNPLWSNEEYAPLFSIRWLNDHDSEGRPPPSPEAEQAPNLMPTGKSHIDRECHGHHDGVRR